MHRAKVQVLSKAELLPFLREQSKLPEVILMVGAGDIDRLVPQVAEWIRTRL